jgi:hypothetical protein
VFTFFSVTKLSQNCSVLHKMSLLRTKAKQPTTRNSERAHWNLSTQKRAHRFILLFYSTVLLFTVWIWISCLKSIEPCAVKPEHCSLLSFKMIHKKKKKKIRSVCFFYVTEYDVVLIVVSHHYKRVIACSLSNIPKRQLRSTIKLPVSSFKLWHLFSTAQVQLLWSTIKLLIKPVSSLKLWHPLYNIIRRLFSFQHQKSYCSEALSNYE